MEINSEETSRQSHSDASLGEAMVDLTNASEQKMLTKEVLKLAWESNTHAQLAYIDTGEVLTKANNAYQRAAKQVEVTKQAIDVATNALQKSIEQEYKAKRSVPYLKEKSALQEKKQQKTADESNIITVEDENDKDEKKENEKDSRPTINLHFQIQQRRPLPALPPFETYNMIQEPTFEHFPVVGCSKLTDVEDTSNNTDSNSKLTDDREMSNFTDSNSLILLDSAPNGDSTNLASSRNLQQDENHRATLQQQSPKSVLHQLDLIELQVPPLVQSTEQRLVVDNDIIRIRNASEQKMLTQEVLELAWQANTRAKLIYMETGEVLSKANIAFQKATTQVEVTKQAIAKATIAHHKAIEQEDLVRAQVDQLAASTLQVSKQQQAVVESNRTTDKNKRRVRPTPAKLKEHSIKHVLIQNNNKKRKAHEIHARCSIGMTENSNNKCAKDDSKDSTASWCRPSCIISTPSNEESVRTSLEDISQDHYGVEDKSKGSPTPDITASSSSSKCSNGIATTLGIVSQDQDDYQRYSIGTKTRKHSPAGRCARGEIVGYDADSAKYIVRSEDGSQEEHSDGEELQNIVISAIQLENGDESVQPSGDEEMHKRPHGVGQYVYHDYANVPESQNIVQKKNGKAKGGVREPFPERLYCLLASMGEDTSVVGWLPHGRAFAIGNRKVFTTKLLPVYFNQSKITSFQRQLNLYGFRRICHGPDRGAYYHELFLRGKQQLFTRMTRQRVKGTMVRQPDNLKDHPDFYAMPPLPRL